MLLKQPVAARAAQQQVDLDRGVGVLPLRVPNVGVAPVGHLESRVARGPAERPEFRVGDGLGES